MTNETTPRHIGVIMDGNRRWAKAQGESKFYGYEHGYKKLIELLAWCLEANIEFLTVYAFSTENFKRDTADFEYIYDLISTFFTDCADYCIANSVVFRFIGRGELINNDLTDRLHRINEHTISPNLTVQIAFGYGGRDEITRAMQSVSEEILSGKYKPSDIDEKFVGKHLDTRGVPDVDMIIRTGNANRLSNFLLWQAHYADIYFLDKMWPALSKEEFMSLVETCKSNRKAEYGS